MTTDISPKPMKAPTRIPGHALLKDTSIGNKLTMGFGLLVALTLLVVWLTDTASLGANATIRDTVDSQMPTALAASGAQANLLRMFGDVRGYLAFGDPQFIESYYQVEHAFQTDLQTLKRLSKNFSAEDRQRLEQLEQAFEQWQVLPPRLFALYDDQMEREPAYAWLNTTGTELSGNVLINISRMIEIQARREPSIQNNMLLRDMATFQGSYAAMFSGLRGYVTTRNPIFRSYEYEVNLNITAETWNELMRKQELLTPEQQDLLAETHASRTAFIEQVPTRVFQVMESDRWREDLFLFDTEVKPLTDRMQQLLYAITKSKQTVLQRDLIAGWNTLNLARIQSLIGGAVAAFLGIALAFIFWRIIVQPIHHLTTVAAQIQAGDLSITAPIESGDEIGVFATTFNNMTAQLRCIMQAIQAEKKRADDLLTIVIPIGVALSSERDFDRLLENILLQAMSFCHADCGALFLKEDQALKLVMMRMLSQNVQMGGPGGTSFTAPHLDLHEEVTGAQNYQHPATYVACTATTVNVANIYDTDAALDFTILKESAAQIAYQPISLLAIPLKNNKHEVLGVLQLINAQEPETGQIIAFDTNLQQMMESFSLLAVAALESYIREQRLRQEIQQLRIEIDESRRRQQVSEIVETDFFQDLQARARQLRQRSRSVPSTEAGDRG